MRTEGVMAKRFDIEHPGKGLSAEEAEALFATVDNSGHVNVEQARMQRERREQYGHGVYVDPLSSDDPSGSNVGKVLTRVAAVLVVLFVGGIVFMQIHVDNVRHENTANLSRSVSVRTVADALTSGVMWGSGFTQFPQEFSVQEADENTGRIEVTVVDNNSDSALLCFSNAQIQATAFAVNSLLNPKINAVIYHVSVHVDENQKIQHSSLFGFMRPTGNLVPFMTYIWTKTTAADGQVRFNCTVTGVDAELQETLRGQVININPDADPNSSEVPASVYQR